jgi:site-specific DNA recombinase
LAAALDRDGIRPRPRKLANGRVIVAESFMVGPLAHILKNRFYIGEIVYRGEVHKGEHEPVLDRLWFDAVQARLAERAVQRKLTRSRSPSILAGLIFDDRGNPMSPSHANKKGVPYRYYVSQALLQSRKTEAGSIARVSAPDVEALVCKALSEAWRTDQGTARTDSDILDQEFISQRVERVVVHADQITVTQRCTETGSDQSDAEAGMSSATNLMIPFSPRLLPRKGIAHAPAEYGTIDPRTQDTLLQPIARSRSWIDAVLAGKTASFDEIASAKGLAERDVRRLVQLAFLSPKIIQAIADGTAPAGLTVSRLTQALSHAWTAQEQMLGLG